MSSDEANISSSLNFILAFVSLRRLLPTQFRLDKHVDFAVHHGLDIARFRAGAVIFHHLVRLKNVGANLAAPGYISLFSVLPIDFGALLILLDFVKLGLQHFHRELAIAPLAALCLAGDNDSTWLMQNPHGSFDFVDVLPALAATAKCVDLKVGRINFYRGSISNFGNNIHTSERSVTPLVCVERRDTHQPVHTAFGL